LSRVQTPSSCDIAIVGAGAAGLMAGIFAARACRGRVVLLDGAKVIGAKILVAGGGRCNVTHHAVDEKQYAGTSRPAIRNVLRRFDVGPTVDFFRSIGVELKREETGKLFPVTDDAHTVLNALLGALRDAGGKVVHPWRVQSVERVGEGFVVRGAEADESCTAKRVILATGGMALPRTGSDGSGYSLAKALGHTVTPRVFPALVPLILEKGHWITALSGLTVPATIELRLSTGKKLVNFTNSTLCTHFGLSGPGVLDISRYYTASHGENAGAGLWINWLPGVTREQADKMLVDAGKNSALRTLMNAGLPDRLARALCAVAAIEPSAACASMHRGARITLAEAATQTPLPVTGDRGFTFAEATAGGVPLSEVHLDTMESRVCPGLYFCGELLDVDGRVGGFNFQWAWSSGWVAGNASAGALGEAER